MIVEARKRAAGLQLPVEYSVGDAHHLAFADNTFDGCWAARVLTHVDNPRQVLAEMVRVARPGARIVVSDPDMETFILEAPDRVLTPKLLNFFCDSFRNGWMGRQLPALFQEVRLADIAVFPQTLQPTYDLLGLRNTVARAQEEGIVSAAEASAWLAQLEKANQAGRFFAAITYFSSADESHESELKKEGVTDESKVLLDFFLHLLT
jgi:hypothetical protein